MRIRNKRIMMIQIILMLAIVLGFAFYNILMPNNRARFFNANTERQYKTSLSQTDIHLAKGQTKELKIEGLSGSITDISWKVADDRVASIVGSSKGDTITLEGKGIGMTGIDVTCSGGTISLGASIYGVQKISLDKNGGTGGDDSFNYGPSSGNPANHCWKGTDYATELTRVAVPTKSGYTFKGYYPTPTVGGGVTQVIDSTGKIIGSPEKYSTLFAIWEKDAPVYTITLNKNGGSGGTDTIFVKNRQCFSDSSCHSPISTIGVPGKSDYTFKGYFPTLDGSGTPVISSDGTINVSYMGSSMTLYAVWESTEPSVATGGTITCNGQTDIIRLKVGETAVLTLNPKPVGATIEGTILWRSTNGLTSNKGEDGRTVTIMADEPGTDTITASFNNGKTISDPITVIIDEAEENYTIKFDANGGSGGPSEIYVKDGKAYSDAAYTAQITKISSFPTRIGYTFKGYYQGTGGIGTPVIDKDGTIQPWFFTTDTLYYAGWEEETVAVTGVTLDKTTASIVEGETVKLTPTIAPDNATNKDVTWKSSDESIATVDANGTVTGVKAGTATITVTTVHGAKTASCDVTVKSKTVEVTDIELSESEASIVVDGTIQLIATVLPSDATNKKVIWESDDESVATVDQNGLVTGKEPGITTIWVTTEDGEFEAECEITVTEKNVPVTGVKLEPSSVRIGVGGTATLVATIQPSNATNKKIIWKSSNELIATVTQDGLVTGKKAGKVTITATTEDGDKTAQATITVEEPQEEDKTPPVVEKVEQSGDTCYITVTDANSGIDKVTVNGKDITSQKASDGRYWFKLEEDRQYVIMVTDKSGNSVTKQFTWKAGSNNNNDNNSDNNGDSSNNNSNNNNNSSNNSNSNNNNSNNNTNNNNNNKTNNNSNNIKNNNSNNTSNSTNRAQVANTTDTSLANKVLPKTGLEKGIVLAMLTMIGFAIFSAIKYKKIQLK